MKMIETWWFMGIFLVATVLPGRAGTHALDQTFQSAYARLAGNRLIVGTGNVERRWRITSEGLVTIGLTDMVSQHEWVVTNEVEGCDWHFDGLGKASLVSLTAKEDDDDQFAASHLEVRAVFGYGKRSVTYVVWAYPGADGLRTQVELPNTGAPDTGQAFDYQQTDGLDFSSPFQSVTAFGYRQGVKITTQQPILREETLPWKNSSLDWANGLVLESGDGGVILVKESNKHTAMPPKLLRMTGDFVIISNQVAMTGAGFSPSMLSAKPIACWANWIILHRGGMMDAQLALKKFDRVRYPVNPVRDVFMMANTWGSEDAPDECRHAAREANVLRELKSCADLGIDALQIDDGWQNTNWLPAAQASEEQHPGQLVKKYGNYPVYPDGFKNVRQSAASLGIKLGLWSAWTIPLQRLEQNYDAADFKYFKLDFAYLADKPAADALLAKARALMAYTGHSARVNWDVTEVVPRMGYFFGREVGNVYLANRKTRTQRPDVQYYPSEMLRDAWLLAKYANLNQFQVTVPNLDIVFKDALPKLTDYRQPYAVGIALMASPIFFQETWRYSPPARALVKSVLVPYKLHREEMNRGYVFPIGEVPNDAHWTGFQDYLPGANAGYLTIFRERNNRQPSYNFKLAFISGKTLRLTDLISGKTFDAPVNERGELTLSMEHPADFRFYRYEFNNAMTR
jgi:hypothetical protein